MWIHVSTSDIAAAIVFTPKKVQHVDETPLRFVFDGDAVLFTNESEKVYQNQGLAGFLRNEQENVDRPMTEVCDF